MLHFKIGQYFNTQYTVICPVMSIFRLTVWLLKGPSTYFLTGTHWFWTGTHNFSRDESQESPKLVFTKSVNSTFCVFWLVPVTQNILGYSLFCDQSQDSISLQGIFRRWNLSNKWSSRTNKDQESDFILYILRFSRQKSMK